MARTLDHKFGFLAMLSGEPRPPVGGFDLKGEKFLDWGFVCANLPPGPKRALEIGPGRSPIIPAMLALGYDVSGIDLCADLSEQVAGFTFIKGDFTRATFNTQFDVIVACSTVEHIGLSGRYSSTEDADGDLKAMCKIATLLEPAGLLFLTVPVGTDAVYKPFHRVYGRQRLQRLIEGFEVIKSRFYVKEPWGPWRPANREAALGYPADIRRYALGEMLLRKTSDDDVPACC